MPPRVYLAGPDVFLPHPEQRAAAQQRICARHGLHGVSPLDPLPQWPGADPASIARRNEAHIRSCQAILANLSPFRGPSADPGTVYEVGFGRALGLPVFGYTTATADYAQRVRALPGSTATHDQDGLAIEDFALFDNLMIACSLTAGGGTLLTEPEPGGWHGLAAFERAATAAAAKLTPAQLSPRGPSRSRTPPATPRPAGPSA